jgi:type IV pilus assembly protein PilO
VRVTGSYHDIAAFTSDVSQLSRIVTLNDVAITNKDAKDQTLTMEAVAKTFRYLDDDEVAAQRKAKDAAKAAKQ